MFVVISDGSKRQRKIRLFPATRDLQLSGLGIATTPEEMTIRPNNTTANSSEILKAQE